MKIEKDNLKNKIILELEENEFTLLAYLIEKSSRKTRNDNFIKAPIDVEINKKFREFLEEEI